LTVYTDDFRAYELLEENDACTREYIVHDDGEFVDRDVHANTCEVSQRTNSCSNSERFSFAVASIEDQDKKP